MKKLAFLLSFVFMIFMLFACSKKIVVDQITFNNDCVTTEVELSKFKLSDYKLTINYSDDTFRDLNIDRSMISDEDYGKLSTIGTHTISISYEDKSLSAIFTLYENATITVDASGGELEGPSSIVLRKGEKLSLLPFATKGDLDLLGWYLVDGTEFTTDTIVNNNITIVADWNDIKKIELKEDTVPTEVLPGNFALTLIVLKITYENGRLDEVNVTADMISDEDNAKTQILGTHTITINYLDNEFECTFTIYDEVIVVIDEQGGILVGSNTLIVRKGSKLSALPVITKTGFEFLGWIQEDGTPFTLDTIINDNIHIIAQWKDN